MDRVTEALEKARQQSRAGGDAGISPVGNWDGLSPERRFSYTHTRTVEVSREALCRKHIICDAHQGRFANSFKLLRTQVLQQMRERGWNAVAVSSPGRAEGKTLTAINLAVQLALEVDQTVLLVDADIRCPAVHAYFGLPSNPGLSDYLRHGTPLQEMLVHPSIGRLVLLPGGSPMPDSSEMLGSQLMMDLVAEMKNRYLSRIVVFDLPPLLSAADALAFSPFVDAALLVVEEGKTSQVDVARAAELLGPKLIGTVLNKSREPELREEITASWLPWLRGPGKG